MARHSHQDALAEPIFEALVESAEAELDGRERNETLFVVFAAGRMGLRAGEIAHVREEWVNWDRHMLEIPSYDACDKGRDGGLCGYCKKRAREAAKWNDDLTLPEAKARRWEPKTENSARVVPFDFNDRVHSVVEEFFFHEDRYAHSRASVNRRLNKALRVAGFGEDRCYPHALRATAATWHAHKGLNPTALQHLFGWADLQTANKYIRKSGAQTREALLKAHDD